jgi:hypothetical protein
VQNVTAGLTMHQGDGKAGLFERAQERFDTGPGPGGNDEQARFILRHRALGSSGTAISPGSRKRILKKGALYRLFSQINTKNT